MAEPPVWTHKRVKYSKVFPINYTVRQFQQLYIQPYLIYHLKIRIRARSYIDLTFNTNQ